MSLGHLAKIKKRKIPQKVRVIFKIRRNGIEIKVIILHIITFS